MTFCIFFVLALHQANTHTYTPGEGQRRRAHLQYLAAVRGAVDVLTRLVHAQCHTVEEDHHDADPLEPRADRTEVKEHRGGDRGGRGG